MRRIAFAFGLMFVVAACGGVFGGSTVDGPTIVSSADGRAVLTFAAESLPEGINATDVHVEWFDVTSTEPGAPSVVVRLTPDGLVFNEPASLRFQLPDMDGNQIVVTHASQDGFEFVGGTIEDIGDHRHLVTPVEHFSLFAATVVEGLTTVVGSADPTIVGVGQAQLVTWEVWIEPISFGMWIPIGPDAKQVQFVTIDDVNLFKDLEDYWGDIDRSGTGKRGANASWDPDYDYTKPVFLDDVFVSFASTAVCTSVNSIDPRVSAAVLVTMTVTARGDTVSNTLFALGDALAQNDATERSGDTGDLTGVLTFGAQLWSDVSGQLFVSDTVESDCVAGADDTTTSSSTTTTLPLDSTTTEGTTSTQPPDTSATTAPGGTTSTTTTSTTSTTTSPTTSTTAPPTETTSKQVSVTVPCPQPVGGESWINVNIPTDAVNPSHTVSPSPWSCPDTAITVAGAVASPGVYRVRFIATSGAGAPKTSVETTITVTWTNP